MKVSGRNITMVRGDNEALGVKVTGYTLTDGDSAEMVIKDRTGRKDIMKKEVSDFSDNSFIFQIMPEDTSGLSTGRYWYSIRLFVDGLVKTVVPLSDFDIIE